ncbi:hypothetical protein L0F63_001293 [Massospora cicadina]|nr:hypothetical protein L0F63_001293 [Massospora cicadina]
MISACVIESNPFKSPVSVAVIYFVVWLREFGPQAGQELQIYLLHGLFKSEVGAVLYDLIAAEGRPEAEVAIWRYLALSKIPSLISRVRETEEEERESHIATAMGMIRSFPRLTSAGGVFQDSTPFELLVSKFQAELLLKPEAFALPGRPSSLEFGSFNNPDIKTFLETFPSKPKPSHFQVLIHILENNMAFQERAAFVCLDPIVAIRGADSRRYGDLSLVLENLLEYSKRLEIIFLYVPISAFLGLVEEFWQAEWLAQGYDDSHKLFGVSVALALSIMELFNLRTNFGGVLKKQAAFPIHLTCLNGPINFEQEAGQGNSQGATPGSQEFSDALTNPHLLPGVLMWGIASGLSEWLGSTALGFFLELVGGKFSFLVFEGINLLFLAISEQWELKASFISFIKGLFTHASLPQHYLQIYASCCLSLLDPSEWAEDEAAELRSIISQRCSFKDINTRGSQMGSYLEGFMVGFYPNQAGSNFIDAFQILSCRMETHGPHAFSVNIVEKMLSLALDFSEAAQLGSAILLLPLLSCQEYAPLAILQLLWAEVIPEYLYQLGTLHYNHGFNLGRLAAKTLLMASSILGFTPLLPTFKAAIQLILTSEVEDAYAALQSLWDPSSSVDGSAFLEPKLAYRDPTLNVSHLGFLTGFLNGPNVLPFFQTRLPSPTGKA